VLAAKTSHATTNPNEVTNVFVSGRIVRPGTAAFLGQRYKDSIAAREGHRNP
jgi:hypothetical protein